MWIPSAFIQLRLRVLIRRAQPLVNTQLSHRMRLFQCLSLLLLPLVCLAAPYYYAIRSPSADRAQQAARYLGVEFLGKIGQLNDYYLLEASESQHAGRDIPQEAATLDSEVKVLDITQTKKGYLRAALHPVTHSIEDLASYLNDPLVSQQWHLSNLQTPTHDLNVAMVWQNGITGKGVTVALVDDGLDYEHPDLKPNFYTEGSYNFNDNTKLPSPGRYDSHGTSCAGEVAGVANNSVCGVGIAYHARVSGLRLIAGRFRPDQEAAALNYDFQNNEIYSNSWGPSDSGGVVEGPGELASAAFENGALNGRGGRGNIYVWASGNGGPNDSCGYDGYTSNVYVAGIGAIGHDNKPTYYSERCSSNLAVTYSGNGNRSIVTVSPKGKCNLGFSGTSAACPMAAGVFALILEARPNLTWRDLQNVIRLSAATFDLDDPTRGWTLLPNGLHYSELHGYGKLDANKSVNFAASENYKLLPPPGNFTVHAALTTPIYIADNQTVIAPLHVDTPTTPFSLEKVTVTVWVSHSRRGDLAYSLTSPSGIVSMLAESRPYDSTNVGLRGWTFTTLKHWDEPVTGTWTLTIQDVGIAVHTGSLEQFHLSFWGAGQVSKTYPTEYKYRPGYGWFAPDSSRSTTTISATVTPTTTPAEPTTTPVEPTDVPVEPTDTPTEPTNTPTEPTDTPVEPTDTPNDPIDDTHAKPVYSHNPSTKTVIKSLYRANVPLKPRN